MAFNALNGSAVRVEIVESIYPGHSSVTYTALTGKICESHDIKIVQPQSSRRRPSRLAVVMIDGFYMHPIMALIAYHVWPLRSPRFTIKFTRPLDMRKARFA